MDASKTKTKSHKLKNILNYIASIISWTVFTVLMICLVFLVYYFISLKIYEHKGNKYKPFFSLYVIVSPSMTPNINVYDVIINTNIDSQEDINIGDVITFKSESKECYGTTVTHRVIAMENQNGTIKYQTKGDANLVPDSALELILKFHNWDEFQYFYHKVEICSFFYLFQQY